MPLPNRNILQIPNFNPDMLKDLDNLAENFRAIDYLARNFPIYQKTTFGPTSAAAATYVGTAVDYGFTTTSNANNTFQSTHTKYDLASHTDIVIYAIRDAFAGNTTGGNSFWGFICAPQGVSLSVGGAGVTTSPTMTFFFNLINNHTQVIQIVKITGLVPGVYNYKPIWASSAPTNINTDTNSQCMYTVEEVRIYP